jgi:hypothetical protein
MYFIHLAELDKIAFFMALNRKQIEEYIAFHKNRKKHPVLRAELFAKNPHCHWCDVKVVLRPEFYVPDLKRGIKPPDDTAVIDHLYNTLIDPENRYKIYRNDEDKVLSCFKCDKERARAAYNKYPREFLDKREQVFLQRKKTKDLTPRPLVLLEEELFQ